jgi:hypothetical protein
MTFTDADRRSMNPFQRAFATIALSVAACTATLPGTPLAIDTVGFQPGPGGCAGVGLQPFRIVRDGEELRYENVGIAEAVRLVWPSGYAARLVNGVGIVYAGNGVAVAQEGEVVEDAGGCPRSDGSILVDIDG